MPPAAVYFDEELEWVEEQIRLAEDGPMNPDPTPDMLQRNRERLVRLRRVRARLLGEEPKP
jgi:hypothetical protein